MISKNTAKIIQLLLRNVERIGYNINQIAKAVKISVGSSFKILKELENNEILLAQKIGNAHYYTLNLENTETIKICELLLIEERRTLSGYAKLYADVLYKFDKADLIILFGSILTKKSFNDVDVLFVTDEVKEVNNFCLELSKIRAKPVIPLILPRKDLISELKNKKEVTLSIIQQGVVLKGESIFIDIIKNARGQIKT